MGKIYKYNIPAKYGADVIIKTNSGDYQRQSMPKSQPMFASLIFFLKIGS